MEEFRPAPSFPGYAASQKGAVKNLVTGKILKACITPRGYVHYEIRGKNVTGHRLVADAFISPRPFNMQINHINGNRADNRATNLEYVTGSENMKHAYATGLQTALRGEKCYAAKMTSGQVEELKKLWASGQFSQRELGIVFGVSGSAICNAVNGRSYCA